MLRNSALPTCSSICTILLGRTLKSGYTKSKLSAAVTFTMKTGWIPAQPILRRAEPCLETGSPPLRKRKHPNLSRKQILHQEKRNKIGRRGRGRLFEWRETAISPIPKQPIIPGKIADCCPKTTDKLLHKIYADEKMLSYSKAGPRPLRGFMAGGNEPDSYRRLHICLTLHRAEEKNSQSASESPHTKNIQD